MSRTLTDIIELLDAGSDVDSLELSVEEEVLAGSFRYEQEERPEMLQVVVEHEELLTRYLGLPADQRALLERLRMKKPEYLEGDYNTKPAISLSSKPQNLTTPSWKLYKDTHSTKAITRIVTHYINHKPTARKGPVPLNSWFQRYEPNTNLQPEIKGKTKTRVTPPGEKYYRQLQRLKQKQPQTTPPFEDWIINQLPQELREQLTQTPYWTQQQLTIEQITQYYINHKPTSHMRPVPLNAWFVSYEPTTNTNLKPKIQGKTQNNGTAPGNKYHKQWHTLKQQQPQTPPPFEDWIINQLGPEIREQLLQTPYFLNKSREGRQ